MSEAHFPSRVPRDEVITLIGYRGSGKTVVGRRLAERLGWDFVDTDERIEAQAGQTIREIFETQGERAFRKLEARVLEDALVGRRCIISAGGGAVLVRGSRKALRTTGICIWLTAPADELWRRIAADAHSATRRPELTAQPGLEEIREVLQARLPVYEATADHVIDTTGRSIEGVVEAILERLGAGVRATEESR